MEILEAFDLTQCAHSAATLAGCDEKTVQRYVSIRDAGGDPCERGPRSSVADPFLEKIEEWVDRSKGKIRADAVHLKLLSMGFAGCERTTRRAVAAAKERFKAGHRRSYRPWVPEPGMWLQFDWGEGPRIHGRRTCLFCAWLAWCRFRIVIPTWDRTMGSLVSCLDATLRRCGGAPTYALTDNEKTVTSDRIANIPVRHPTMVGFGQHYGVQVCTCEPHDPESKGGSESTVKIAKADLLPKDTNLREDYDSFGELDVACEAFGERVNARPHRETGRAPVEMLAEERTRLHVLPRAPFTVALGQTRTVDDDQTVRFGSVRYSTPPGHVRTEVWCRVDGEELVIVARTERGLGEIARHELSTPGHPRIVDAHYPNHPPGNERREPRLRPRSAEETAFLAIGPGAERWLREAAATGTARVRAKMTEAVVLSQLLDPCQVDRALGLAAIAHRFADGDLHSIVEHLQRSGAPGECVIPDEAHSAQPGTTAWSEFGR
jgi:transposase